MLELEWGEREDDGGDGEAGQCKGRLMSDWELQGHAGSV